MTRPTLRATASILVLLTVGALPEIAAATAAAPLQPLRVDEPPVLDGVLDDPCWRQAPTVTGFRTFHPDYDVVPTAPTVVSMAYDADHLYFAFRCLEDEPERIKSSLTSRDNLYADDWVCLNLDTFGDQQALVALYVNPAGVQGDGRFTAGQEDRSIDLVWYSAGRVDPDGYTVEMAVPLKSLRFAETEPVRMAVFFERYVSRRSEHQSFPRLDPAQGQSFLVQMQPMEYPGLRQARLLELLPAATYQQTHRRGPDGMEPLTTSRDLSLTAKYGLTSDLVLDATLNPDFSQIEADAGQVDVNLRTTCTSRRSGPSSWRGARTSGWPGPPSRSWIPCGRWSTRGGSSIRRWA